MNGQVLKKFKKISLKKKIFGVLWNCCGAGIPAPVIAKILHCFFLHSTICEHASLQQQPEEEADCGADPDLVLALALSISSAAAETADPPELEQLPPMTAAAAADTSSSSQLLPSSARPTMWLPQPYSALQPFK